MSMFRQMGLDPGQGEGAVVGGTSGALLAAILELLLRQRGEQFSGRRLLGLAGMGGAAGGLVGQGVGKHMALQQRLEQAAEER